MKALDLRIRLKQFQVEEKIRKLAQIDQMIVGFGRMIKDLEQQIEVEKKQQSNKTSPNKFFCSSVVETIIQRKKNLDVSIRELNSQRVNVNKALEKAKEGLLKVEMLEKRNHSTDSFFNNTKKAGNNSFQNRYRLK